MTIEEAIAFQKEHDSLHVHVVHVGPKGWTVAHTEWERAEGMDTMVDCDLNDWLEGFEEQPVPTGWYAALEEPWDGWELLPFDAG